MGNTVVDRASLLACAQQDYAPAMAGIDHDMIASLEWPVEAIKPMSIQLPEHIGHHPVSAFSFLLAMTGLNYRFWTLLPDGSLDRYRHLGTSGSRALWAAFESVWASDSDPVAKFGGQLRREGFNAIFGDMPDTSGRQQILEEILAGNQLTVLCEELMGEIISSGTTGVAHAARLASTFPQAFADPYLKKAQLALSMFAAYLRSCGEVVDVADLTAFADYQVPRVLRALQIIHYSPELAAKVDGHVMLPPGSAEERAIRAGTILACDSIAKHIKGTDADVDNLLWQSQDMAGETRFHGGGQANNYMPGDTKRISCASGTPNPDKWTQQSPPLRHQPQRPHAAAGTGGAGQPGASRLRRRRGEPGIVRHHGSGRQHVGRHGGEPERLRAGGELLGVHHQHHAGSGHQHHGDVRGLPVLGGGDQHAGVPEVDRDHAGLPQDFERDGNSGNAGGGDSNEP